MTQVRIALKAQQADGRGNGDIPRRYQRVLRRLRGQMRIEYFRHLVAAPGAGCLPTCLGCAQRPQMNVADAERFDRCAQQGFGKTRFAGRRYGADVQQYRNASGGQAVEKLVLHQPLIAAGEQDRRKKGGSVILPRPVRGQCSKLSRAR